jgi:hypothetical protein
MLKKYKFRNSSEKVAFESSFPPPGLNGENQTLHLKALSRVFYNCATLAKLQHQRLTGLVKKLDHQEPR